MFKNKVSKIETFFGGFTLIQWSVQIFALCYYQTFVKVKLQTGEQGLCCCGFFRTVMMGVWELSQEHCRDSVARLCPKVRIPVCLCNKLDVSSQHNIDTLGNNRVALVATFKMACTLIWTARVVLIKLEHTWENLGCARWFVYKHVGVP